MTSFIDAIAYIMGSWFIGFLFGVLYVQLRKILDLA